MSRLMKQVLGADWDRLPPALQAHYRDDGARDLGRLDIEFPGCLLPLLWAMRLVGALVHRRGNAVETTVHKQAEGGREHWRRTLRYADGRVLHFDSYRVAAGAGRLIEFVNPVLGLELALQVVGEELHCSGTRMVARLGPWLLTVPEWLVLGHTTIVERVDGQRYTMDFRMTHPLLGELFRYAGQFAADV